MQVNHVPTQFDLVEVICLIRLRLGKTCHLTLLFAHTICSFQTSQWRELVCISSDVGTGILTLYLYQPIMAGLLVGDEMYMRLKSRGIVFYDHH